jgi:hypothetical protein
LCVFVFAAGNQSALDIICSFAVQAATVLYVVDVAATQAKKSAKEITCRIMLKKQVRTRGGKKNRRRELALSQPMSHQHHSELSWTQDGAGEAGVPTDGPSKPRATTNGDRKGLGGMRGKKAMMAGKPA